MLTLFLWWLSREWAYLKSILWNGKDTSWYFAFGANVDPSMLKQRKIRVLDIKPYMLDGYKLCFNHQSPFKGAGFASAELAKADESQKVYGYLIQMPKPDGERMDCLELVPFFKRYRRISLSQNNVEFFFYSSNIPRDGFKPTKKYLNMILTGLRKHPDIKPQYLTELEQMPVITHLERSNKTNYVFKDLSSFPAFLRHPLQRYDAFIGWAIFYHVRYWTIFGWFLKTE